MKVIDELQKLCTSGRVEAGNRLVEHEYTGAHGEHAGKSAAALLTAREFKGALLRNFIGIKAYESEGLEHALADLIGG